MTLISSSLLQASSLHPKIVTTIDLEDSVQPQSECHLDVVYFLPPSVFVDPYQLKDLEPVLGKTTVFGEHDLELPLEKIKNTRGSVVFVRRSNVASTQELELPIHLRYQQPSEEEEEQLIRIEPPNAGWTCGPSSQWPPLFHPLIPKQPNQDKMRFIPFTRDSTSMKLYVPVGKAQDTNTVSIGTLAAIIIGTLWIIYSIVTSLKKRKRSEAKGKRRKSE